MASKLSQSLALFLVLNLVFFSLVSACGECGSPKPKTKPKPTPSTGGTCTLDTLKLGVCANVLNGLVDLTIGSPPKEPCCPLVQGLIDAEAAVCLCTAIKADILGIHLNIPVSLSLLVNYCGCKLPNGFQCP
ncbi:14 kDa proline-rich protein DC2.15-like [Amaranthus tricolor]|uniref:14 kDa proline-rich protein DC2.15-like n=1 Tax=Amaranthus tricolor TaxID=29722 RepID=UPI002585B8B8|nr:14 kDa proline-rich protein DC2.15-like [Amaranthus tricolor]